MSVIGVIKAFGIDFTAIGVILTSWLPVIQGIISLAVVILVFLIQLHRYKKIKSKPNEEVKKKKGFTLSN